MKKRYLYFQMAVCILVLLCEGCNSQTLSTPSPTSSKDEERWNGEGLDFTPPEPLLVKQYELPCPKPSQIVDGEKDDLQVILDNANPKDVIAVMGNLKADILISKPITLTGINQDGACLNLSTIEELPTLNSITVSPEGGGSVISGFQIVKSGVQLLGSATMRNIVISGGQTCLEIDASCRNNKK